MLLVGLNDVAKFLDISRSATWRMWQRQELPVPIQPGKKVWDSESFKPELIETVKKRKQCVTKRNTLKQCVTFCNTLNSGDKKNERGENGKK